MHTLYTIGIGGGSGSGKSTITKALQELAGKEEVTVLHLDWYFSFDTPPPTTRDEHAQANLDHPRHVDRERAAQDIRALQEGRTITPPTHTLLENGKALQQASAPLSPSTFLLVEGLHALTFPELEELYDFQVFVQTPEEVRVQRRIERDPGRTGQTPDEIRDQLEASVLPMHKQHVEPSAEKADLVVDGTQDPELLARHIRQAVLST